MLKINLSGRLAIDLDVVCLIVTPVKPVARYEVKRNRTNEVPKVHMWMNPCQCYRSCQIRKCRTLATNSANRSGFR